MNIYLISRDGSPDWDEYEDAVVFAETPQAAKNIHPNGYTEKDGYWNETWVPSEDVIVKYLGTANEGAKEGVICASFNAG